MELGGGGEVHYDNAYKQYALNISIHIIIAVTSRHYFRLFPFGVCPMSATQISPIVRPNPVSFVLHAVLSTNNLELNHLHSMLYRTTG